MQVNTGQKGLRVPAKQSVKRTKENKLSLPVTKGLFRGAKIIEFTENNISVTHVTGASKKGSYERQERRQYMPKTDATVAAANAAIRSGQIKKVRVEFKK